jgi:hypothetical protein
MTKLTPMRVYQQAAEQEHVHDVSKTDIKEPPAAAAAKSLKDSMLKLFAFNIPKKIGCRWILAFIAIVITISVLQNVFLFRTEHSMGARCFSVTQTQTPCTPPDTHSTSLDDAVAAPCTPAVVAGFSRYVC